MMSFLRKYKVHVMCTILAVFVIYIALGFGTSLFTHVASPNDSVVDVDSDKVTLKSYLTHFSRATADLKTPLDDAGRKQKRDETIRDLVQAIVFKRETDHYGIVVPNMQVATSLTQIQAFQTKGQFDPQLYMKTLVYQLKSTPAEFEEEQRQSIAFFKLRWLIQSGIKVTDQEAQLAYAVEHKNDMTGFEKNKETYRQKLWQDKVLFAFNQWFSQMGQKIKVKPHLDVLEGVPS